MSLRPGILVFALSCAAIAVPATGHLSSTRPSTKPARAKLVLVTKNYEITITRSSGEGNVEDDHVTYHGVSKKSGNDVTLTGSTWHTHGPDGTPSHFLGYRFRSGNVTYLVMETGRLTVVRGDSEVLVDEVGKWLDP
jgi:hypothetical protein